LVFARAANALPSGPLSDPHESVGLPPSSAVCETFVAVRAADGRQAILTLYADDSEPDPAVYDALRKLPRDHVPEIIATGRWHDRAFEVTEVTSCNFSDLLLSSGDVETVRQIVDQLGRALNAFSECGLRHRDLRPAVVLVRSREPLDLAITGFGSARLSEFDLDIVSPLETTRYMAPEAIAGGVAAASDWWSLGMLLLEGLTRGACFEGVNEQAFLIHVLTNGVPIPQGLDPSLDLLLRGLNDRQ
jgi:primosomal replication protein N''